MQTMQTQKILQAGGYWYVVTPLSGMGASHHLRYESGPIETREQAEKILALGLARKA
jgi:hypothetical protein